MSIDSASLQHNGRQVSQGGNISARADDTAGTGWNALKALCFTVLVLLLAGCGGATGSVELSYRPPLLPVTFSIDNHWHISVTVGGSITTGLGTFSVNAGIAETGSDSMLVSIVRTVNGARETTDYRINEYGGMTLCVSGQARALITLHTIVVTPAYAPSQVELLPGNAPCSFPPAGPTLVNSPTPASGQIPGGASPGGTTIASAPVLVPGRTYSVNLADAAAAQLVPAGDGPQDGSTCPMWAGEWWKLDLQVGDTVSVNWSYSPPASGFYQFLVFSPSTTDSNVLDEASQGNQVEFANYDFSPASDTFTVASSGTYPFIIGDGCPSTSGPFQFIVQVNQ
jgi:hypothetical protein